MVVQYVTSARPRAQANDTPLRLRIRTVSYTHLDVYKRQVLEEALASPETTVAYDSPHRLRDTLQAIAELDGARPVAMARELTKLHEEVLRGTAAEVLAALATRENIKGECAVIIAGRKADTQTLDEAQIARIIADAASALPASKAAQQVAKLTGLARDEAFARILRLKGKA